MWPEWVESCCCIINGGGDGAGGRAKSVFRWLRKGREMGRLVVVRGGRPGKNTIPGTVAVAAGGLVVVRGGLRPGRNTVPGAWSPAGGVVVAAGVLLVLVASETYGSLGPHATLRTNYRNT